METFPIWCLDVVIGFTSRGKTLSILVNVFKHHLTVPLNIRYFDLGHVSQSDKISIYSSYWVLPPVSEHCPFMSTVFCSPHGMVWYITMFGILIFSNFVVRSCLTVPLTLCDFGDFNVILHLCFVVGFCAAVAHFFVRLTYFDL